MELGNSHKSRANQRPWPPGPPMGALGPDQIGPILELISPLVLPQNGPKWPPMARKGYPEYTRVMFWVTAQDLGPLGPFWCKKEEKLAPKWAQFGPVQELTWGVLEARDVNWHHFYDYFPSPCTHTK